MLQSAAHESVGFIEKNKQPARDRRAHDRRARGMTGSVPLSTKPAVVGGMAGHPRHTPPQCKQVVPMQPVRIIMSSGVVHANGKHPGKERPIEFRSVAIAGFFPPFF